MLVSISVRKTEDSAKAKPVNLARLKFKPAKLPALTREQKAEIGQKYSKYMAKKLIKLGTRLLKIRKGKVGQNTLMFWPWSFSKANPKVKTPYGTFTRHDIYAAMAAGPTNVTGGKRGMPMRGYALCRVCGARLGTSDIVLTNGFIVPEKVAHYSTHGIKPNLVTKAVFDKDTETWYTVTYIGAVGEV